MFNAIFDSLSKTLEFFPSKGKKEKTPEGHEERFDSRWLRRRRGKKSQKFSLKHQIRTNWQNIY